METDPVQRLVEFHDDAPFSAPCYKADFEGLAAPPLAPAHVPAGEAAARAEVQPAVVRASLTAARSRPRRRQHSKRSMWRDM